MAQAETGTQTKKFVFKKNTNIGAADAIDDRKFLEQCFVDNGSIPVLTDVNDPRAIVLGRTGSGKTALLEQINRDEERVIKISPDALALTYISTNATLKFFKESGVNLELFYELLWRHVFAVEIIRTHFNIVSEREFGNFWSRLWDILKNNAKKRRAVEYLRQWGESFWMDSEHRIIEITKTFEDNLKKSLDIQASPSIYGTGAGFGLAIGGERKLSEEQRIEVLHRGQKVVDSVQIHTLSEIINLIETDLLDDKKKRYYITIDRLDENWVNDEFRYDLIKALIDAIKDFNHKISNVKIIVAIREDLLDRVFRFTRASGHQQEKYRSIYFKLSWNRAELEKVLNFRVNHLIKEQYTTQSVAIGDLFPKKLYNQDALDYFFERTLMRPRDAILFFNECIEAAVGRATFTQDTVQQAEVVYSESRLQALEEEWIADYPHLFDLAMFLKRQPSQFRLAKFCDNLEDNTLNFLTTHAPDTQLYALLMTGVDSGDVEALAREILRIFFRVGIVGIKEPSTNFLWSYLGNKLMPNALSEQAIIKVHPAFWQVLGIWPDKE